MLRGRLQSGPAVSFEDGPSTSKCIRPTAIFSVPGNRRASVRCRVNRDLRKQDFNLWKGLVPPIPAGHRPGVIPGKRTVATPLLTNNKIFMRLKETVHDNARDHFGAFYSSVLGGMVTHPGFMVMHLDDHMVHRGHGVYDSVKITNGYLYRLPEHALRLRANAEELGVYLQISDDAVMGIMLDTAAASKKMNGKVTVWITAGRGGFGISSLECIEPCFYAIATDCPSEAPNREAGWNACSSTVPPHPSSMAALNTNNFLPEIMAQLEAEGRGCNVALLLDPDSGNVVSASDMSMALITTDNVLVVTPVDSRVRSSSLQRLVELIPQAEGLGISKVEVRDFGLSDVVAAKEAFAVNDDTGVVPIVSVDGQAISGGTVGKTALALQALLEADMDPQQGASINHIPVPYDYGRGW